MRAATNAKRGPAKRIRSSRNALPLDGGRRSAQRLSTHRPETEPEGRSLVNRRSTVRKLRFRFRLVSDEANRQPTSMFQRAGLRISCVAPRLQTPEANPSGERSASRCVGAGPGRSVEACRNRALKRSMVRAASHAVTAVQQSLLQLHLTAGLFELRLQLVGFFAGHALLDRARRLVDQGLRLLQTKAGDGAHLLDDGNLVA